jgi:DNA-binding MarR family transcriptional regulator
MFELDRFLPYLVNKLGNRLSQELGDVYASRFGISIPEWRVIAHLSQHRDVSVREVFSRVAMDKAKVSRAAARLEMAGLVEKNINPADKRLVALKLTDEGRALSERIAPLALAYEAEVLSALDKGEQETFRHLLARLLARDHKRPD